MKGAQKMSYFIKTTDPEEAVGQVKSSYDIIESMDQ
jgi:hypothetical protein